MATSAQPPPLQLATSIAMSTASSSTSSPVPAAMSVAHANGNGDTADSPSADNSDQTLTVIVKTDVDGGVEPTQPTTPPSNPVLMNNLATSAAMARMANASFAEFASNLNLPAIVLPSGPVPLVTTASESEGTPSNKREIRLLKNREAAKECRRKKKEYVRCLESRVAVLEAQNTKLMDELKTLKDMYCHKVEETNVNMLAAAAAANQVAVPEGVNVTVQPVPQPVSVAMLNAIPTGPQQ